MYTRQPGKMLTLQILDVLNKHSDAEHRLSQRDIAELLEKEHGTRADRGTIKRLLMQLHDYGYDIEWAEIPRKDARGEEANLCTGFYIQRLFDSSQLRLLIDSLFFSRYVPKSAAREMIDKLRSLTSRHFKAGVSSMTGLQDRALANPQLFYTIEVLDEAISSEVQVSFLYLSPGPDKMMRPRTDRLGRVLRYTVTPYRLVAANGWHYLIANHARHRNISHLRVDRMAEVTLTDKKAKPLREVEGMEQGLRLPEHMAEHIYMFSGPSAEVSFTAPPGMMDSILDWFGSGVNVQQQSNDLIRVSVRVNLAAMRCWALQYARHITLLSPESLVKEVRQDLEESARRYAKAD